MVTRNSEWLCVGSYCAEAGGLLRTSVTSAARIARAIVPERVLVERWGRYAVALSTTAPAAPDVELQPLTDDIVDEIRRHPDHGADQVRSGLKFWDHGLRGAFIWMIDGAPACMQWLLTSDDQPLLRSLNTWGAMYVPLPPDCGQVENLYAFTTARRKGVATQFEYALFEKARGAGLTRLVTHIHEANTAARGWADRTGWQAYGVITRYRLDVPGLRSLSLFLHEDLSARSAKEPGLAHAVPAAPWTR